MGSLVALYIYSTPPVQRARSHLSSFGCPIRSFWPRPKCPGPASPFLLSFLKLLKCLDQHQDHPKVLPISISPNNFRSPSFVRFGLPWGSS